MDDETIILNKGDVNPSRRQSTIFNTSVRGWIALALALMLSLCLLLIVVAPYFKVQIPDVTATPLVTLFISGFTAAITHYFQQQSKEGQK